MTGITLASPWLMPVESPLHLALVAVIRRDKIRANKQKDDIGRVDVAIDGRSKLLPGNNAAIMPESIKPSRRRPQRWISNWSRRFSSTWEYEKKRVATQPSRNRFGQTIALQASSVTYKVALRAAAGGAVDHDLASYRVIASDDGCSSDFLRVHTLGAKKAADYVVQSM